MGTIVSLAVGGFFCTYSFDKALPFIFRFGWTYFFYLLGAFECMLVLHAQNVRCHLGGLGIVWSVVWLIFASDTPLTNAHISENEREYIRACKAEEKIQDTRSVRQRRRLPPPVIRIAFD